MRIEGHAASKEAVSISRNEILNAPDELTLAIAIVADGVATWATPSPEEP